jgi:hypothetical protein
MVDWTRRHPYAVAIFAGVFTLCNCLYVAYFCRWPLLCSLLGGTCCMTRDAWRWCPLVW